MGIQLGSHFQGIIINIIIDNMKTILSFLALAALATARPQTPAEGCPEATPFPCVGNGNNYCVAAQAECPVPIMRQIPAAGCPEETPLPCVGEGNNFCVAAQAECPVPIMRQIPAAGCPEETPLPCVGNGNNFCVAAQAEC